MSGRTRAAGPALLDEGDEAVRIGERVVAERQHRALRPGIDLLDIGAAAQRLDGDDLEQLLAPRPAAGRSGRASSAREAVDLAVALRDRRAGDRASSRTDRSRDVVLRDQHRRADGDLRRPAVGDRLGNAGLQRSATASSSICW